MTEIYTQADLNRLATQIADVTDKAKYWKKKANDQGPGRGDAGHAWRFMKYTLNYVESDYLSGQLNEEMVIAQGIRNNQKVAGELMGDSISITSPKTLLILGGIGLLGFFAIKRLRK